MKPKYKKKNSIPIIHFEYDPNRPLWWNIFINEKWIVSFMNLNEAVDYIYSIYKEGTFGSPLDLKKKY